MKFLVIRFSSIGDIVLTTPVIRCLKQQVKDAEVHYLTKKKYSGIVRSNPFVDRIHELDDNWNALIENLKSENFDFIIDLHHNLRTLRIKLRLGGVRSFAFDKLNIEKWLIVNLRINRLPKMHIVDRYLATLAYFSVSNDGKGLDYFIPEKDLVPADHLPVSHYAGYVALVIGGALGTKKLPSPKLAELCAKIPYPIILLGGEEDRQDGEKLAGADSIRIYNACGKFNLNESADILRQSKLVITHDTGLMHIAAAFHKPVLSIWGNTIPEFGMYPYYGNSVVPGRISEVKKLSCRPCSKIGYAVCPLGHFNCMEQQNIDKMVKSIKELLQKGWSGSGIS